MFSIIIPLYNKADYVAETLRSVLNQTYNYYEVIVVNDSSTDNSLEIVSSFHDKRIHIYTKKNEGVSAARNYGIMHAKHDYIAFLDADDIWDIDYLECQKKMIDKYPNAGIYSIAFYMIKYGKKVFCNILPNKERDFLIDDYFKQSVVNGLSICWTSSLCLRKDIIKHMPMFRVGIKRGEDLDLWLRVALEYDIAYLNQAKVFKNGIDTLLTSLEYKILLTLALNPDTIFSREKLLADIWDVNEEYVYDNTLTVYIKRIRDKIEDNPNNPKIILTIRGVGYKVGSYETK